MIKRFALALALILLGSGGASLAAQVDFEALVYDNHTGIIQRINAGGTILDTIQLPIPEGYTGFSAYAAVYDGYPLVAYRVSNEDETRSQFIVYRYDADEILVAHVIEQPIYDYLDYDTSRYTLFNRMGYVAYAYTSRTEEYAWTILIFNHETGELEYQLFNEDLPYEIDIYHPVPLPYQFDYFQLSFGLRALHCPCFPAQEPIYRWSLQDQVVGIAPEYISFNHDESGGVMVTLMDDFAFGEAWQHQVPMSPQANMVALLFENDRLLPFFLPPEPLRFRDVYFIENGTRILVQTLDEADAAHWFVVDVDGVTLELPESFSPTSVHGTREGFTFTDGKALFSVVSSDDSVQLLRLADTPGTILYASGKDWDDSSAVSPIRLLEPRSDPDPLWTAALYENSRIWFINHSGQIIGKHRLPLPTAYPDAVIAQTALAQNYAAYTIAYDQGAAQFANYRSHLYLYDLGAQQVIYDAPLPQDTVLHRLEFASSDSNVMYLSTIVPRRWEISQIRIDTRLNESAAQVVATLASDDPRLNNYQPNIEGMSFPPTVRILYTGDDRVLLTLDAQNDADDRAQIIEWQPETGSVSILAGIEINPGRIGICRHHPNCANAVIFAQQESRFELMSEDAFNTLQVFFPHTGALFPFYTSPARDLLRAFFVDNGALILVEELSQGIEVTWQVLTRAGQPIASLGQIQPRITDAAGTHTGFLYTVEGDVYHTTLEQVGNEQTPLAQLPATRLNILWLWEVVEERSSPITEWQNLHDAFPVFAIGDTVVITEAGNQLRMRVTPSGEVQRQFNVGARVTIVGDSQVIEGVRWWQVRDENELVGWIAEGDGSMHFIAPAS